MPDVDYDKIAAQHGGTAVVDYDALAAQHGGAEAPQGLHAALQGATGISATPWYSRPIVGGVSAADALAALPAVGGAIGGVLGAGSGAFAGMGLGAVPGAVGGAAIGGGAGEAARQLGARAIGVPAPASSSEAAIQIGQQGGVQAGAELLGRVAAPIAGKVVKSVLPEPAKQYAQALGATTVQNKVLSEKIVPELIKRQVTGSREAIKRLAEGQIGKVGAELDTALAKVPKGQAADVAAVMNQLQKLKRQYVVPSAVPGANTIVDQAAYDSLSKMQTLVAGTQPTFESVRRLRQILDGMVTAGDKTFGRTIAEGSELDATREAANAIRRELAKGSPDVARINKEFSFWKNVDRVVGATIQRTASQAKGLGQQIAESVAAPAAAAAVSVGHAGPGAAVAMPVLLRKVLQSPAWKTFSAVQKDRLAGAIASGDAQRVGSLVSHLLTGAADVYNERDAQP